MTLRCLIIDDMESSISKLLEEIGIQSDYRPDITKEELLEIVNQYEGIIVRSKVFFGKEIIEKATKLKFIGRAGAGLDNLDVAELEKRNITLLNAPEGNRDAVAEQAVASLLALMNNLFRADFQVRKGVWDREGNRGYELMGKTVAIIGYGYMGQATAKRLSGFGCNVITYDKYKKNVSDQYAEACDMDTVFEKADIVSMHIPLTEETRYLVSENYFNSFKKPIWFMNTARGEIVSLSAVVNALQGGKLRGAVLDVLENEKLATLTPSQSEAFNYLIQSDKVAFSPHIAGWTFESYEKINKTLVQKIKKII